MFSGETFRNIFNPDNTSQQDEEDQAMSHDELVDYFTILVTTYSSPETPSKVAKWDKPVVTISIENIPPENGIKVVDDFINKFNSNSTKTKLERTAKNGDIRIYFNVDTSGSAGRSGPSTGADYIIDSAQVKLDERVAVFEQSLSSVFSHEMFHALGFTGHYQGNDCRLMSTSTCGSHLSINEERLIQMLYSTDIPVKSGEPEIKAYFQNWNPK